MDDYAAIASIYDDWQERFGSFWRVSEPRLRATLDRYPPPTPVNLVDLGCGTGSLLLALRRRHPDWELTGLDASSAMIDVARRKPESGSIAWVRGGFEEVRGPHGVAVSFFDALNHAVDLPAACQGVARALVPGGLFIFDLNNRIGFESWWQGQRHYDGRGWTLTMDASFDGRLARGRATVERGDSTTVTEVVECCFEETEVRAALEGAELQVMAVDAWRPMPGDVPGKTWWVARRAVPSTA